MGRAVLELQLRGGDGREQADHLQLWGPQLQGEAAIDMLSYKCLWSARTPYKYKNKQISATSRGCCHIYLFISRSFATAAARRCCCITLSTSRSSATMGSFNCKGRLLYVVVCYPS